MRLGWTGNNDFFIEYEAFLKAAHKCSKNNLKENKPGEGKNGVLYTSMQKVLKIASKVGRLKSRRDISLPFEERDEQNVGYISKRRFKRALDDLHADINDKDLDIILSYFEGIHEGNKVIVYREFINMCLVDVEVLNNSINKVCKAASRLGRRNRILDLKKVFQKFLPKADLSVIGNDKMTSTLNNEKFIIPISAFNEGLADLGLSIIKVIYIIIISYSR